MSDSKIRIIYVEDDPDMISGLQQLFPSKYCVKFIEKYDSDSFLKELEQFKPHIVIVDDDLDGTTYFANIGQDVRTAIGHTHQEIFYIGCTNLDVDLKDQKKKYKNEGYKEFFKNSGTKKDIVEMCKLIDSLIP